MERRGQTSRDVAPAIDRRGQQTQQWEVLHAAAPGADRDGALHQGGLARLASDAQLHRDRAAGIGDGQLRHRVRAEAGHGGRQVELAEPEMGARGIHANEIVVAIQRDPAAGAAEASLMENRLTFGEMLPEAAQAFGN